MASDDLDPDDIQAIGDEMDKHMEEWLINFRANYRPKMPQDSMPDGQNNQ